MEKLRVVVSGSGYMGREVLSALAREDDLEPVGVIEKLSPENFISVPGYDALLPMSDDPAALIASKRPDVVVDFSNAAWTPAVTRAALANDASLVIGTTGLSDDFLSELAEECKSKRIGAVVAPNFAIGAVLMVHLARIASRYFDYAEISEMHQEKKLDAPSGTAVHTAQEMVKARGRAFARTEPEKETLAGSRGAEYEGVSIHSQRMPGFVAHQEVVFGGLGQTLRLRHDSTGRESFIPGVLLALREVRKRNELVIGLDKLIGL
jgi:4-hydroxy-tetrahydrodipicolinate reductase